MRLWFDNRDQLAYAPSSILSVSNVHIYLMGYLDEELCHLIGSEVDTNPEQRILQSHRSPPATDMGKREMTLDSETGTSHGECKIC